MRHALPTLGLALLLGTALAPTPARATSPFFEWASTSAGSGGGIDASISFTVNAGLFWVDPQSASDPSFISMFDSTFSALKYNALPGPANIASTIDFSAPLPTGTRLIVIDVDYRQERVSLLSDNGPLLLLAQIETMDGAMSSFPIYNAATGDLVSQNLPSPYNDFEASVFDVSGVNTLDIGFLNGNDGSGITVAIALPPVPEPATWALAGMGMLALAWRRRQVTTGA